MTEGQSWLRILGLSLVVCIAWEMGLMAATVTDFYPQLTPNVGGWKKAQAFASYTPNNLSDYIDGGAELFISFNFERALALKYEKAGNPEIKVDIFDMGSSADAFGVFAHSRESIDAQVGQGCEYAAGLLTFWQDRFYVSILAYPETAEKREVVFKLGREIAAKIARKGATPAIVGWLPTEGLIPESVRFFHHYIWLNSFFYLSDENILDIGPSTPTALGKYRQPKGTFFVLLVSFPDEAKAQAATKKFANAYLGGPRREPVNVKDGGWTGYTVRGRLFAAVFKAPDSQSVRTTLEKIKKTVTAAGGSR